LLRQRIAVDGGRGIGRRSRRVEQDCRNGAAHGDAAHHPARKRQGRERLQSIGERHQERQRRSAAQARNCPEDKTDHHAESEEDQLVELEQALDAA
jgi:hypothetical protein